MTQLIHSTEPASVVIFDLDDTLYLQRDYLNGAWMAVAHCATEQGVDERALIDALLDVSSRGSDQGGIIDKALDLIGVTGVEVQPLVEAFLGFQPQSLELLPGVPETLANLRSAGIPTAIVTDGSLKTQRAKLDALGVEQLVDVVVLSDEAGRQYRKPHPRPFLTAIERLRVAPSSAVVIGDRPDKDVAAAAGAGIRAVRVQTGEYANRPDHPFTWRTARNAPQAVEDLLRDGFIVAGS